MLVENVWKYTRLLPLHSFAFSSSPQLTFAAKMDNLEVGIEQKANLDRVAAQMFDIYKVLVRRQYMSPSG